MESYCNNYLIKKIRLLDVISTINNIDWKNKFIKNEQC